MTSSEKQLAEALDTWVDGNRALVTERPGEIVVGGLSHQDALAALAGFDAIGWRYSIEDGSPSIVTKSQVHPEFEPYRITATKPIAPDGHDFVLTNTGLTDWLSRQPAQPVLEVSRLKAGFETLSVRFEPRDDRDQTAFVPESLGCDPRTVVRETGATRVVPGDLSHWILRTGSEADLADPAAATWANIAAVRLARSLCNEMEGTETLVLKGTPVSRYTAMAGMATRLAADGFRAIQQCAQWVFTSPKEMDSRHILLTAELSRSTLGSDDAAELFRRAGLAALEGAKIAYELSLQKISADTLKALSDLRKAVSDETAKLGDNTRQLATAVSSALFGGIALIVTRLTLAPTSLPVAAAVLLIGIVLSVYVGTTIWSGHQFVAIQRDLRNQWRNRLYRFLPEDEYTRMVVAPAKRAEDTFSWASRISGILAFVLLASVICVSGPQLRQAFRDWRASGAAQPADASKNSKSATPSTAQAPSAAVGGTPKPSATSSATTVSQPSLSASPPASTQSSTAPNGSAPTK